MVESIKEKQAWVPKEGTSTGTFKCHQTVGSAFARCTQQCKAQGRMFAENAAVLPPTISTRITQDIRPDPVRTASPSGPRVSPEVALAWILSTLVS